MSYHYFENCTMSDNEHSIIVSRAISIVIRSSSQSITNTLERSNLRLQFYLCYIAFYTSITLTD